MKLAPGGAKVFKAAWALFLALAPLIYFHWIFGGFFPNSHGGLGLDYSYFFPRLLDGYFWYQNNGIWAPPWFTPSFCGGLPSFGNPQGMYYSLPQLLTILVGPLDAVYLTYLLFLFAGFIGFYLMSRHGLGVSAPLAYLGAALFMGNGFYTYNMLIGHFAFHAYQLTPLACYFLIRPAPEGVTGLRKRLVMDSILAGMVFAVMIYSGMLVLGGPVALAVVLVGVISGMAKGGERLFWGRLALAGAIALAVGASRLEATLAFMGQFGRDYYDFPGGIKPLVKLIWLVIQTLFLWPDKMLIYGAPFSIGHRKFVHSEVYYEYGVTLVPLALAIISGYLLIKRRGRGLLDAWRLPMIFNLAVAALVVGATLALNYSFDNPKVGAFLKTVPLLGSYSNFVTWLCVLIPGSILAPLLMFDRLGLGPRAITGVACAGLAVAAWQTYSHDKSFYADQHYGYGVIQEAWRKTERSGQPPAVERIVDQSATNKEHALKIFPLGGDDYLASGGSQMDCYEPIFGYSNFKLPWKNIKPGPVMTMENGEYNIKNPACYSYPKENGCLPGDHFKEEQRQFAEAFRSHRPFAFHQPLRQKVANWITIIALVFSASYLAYCAVGALRVKAGVTASRPRKDLNE